MARVESLSEYDAIVLGSAIHGQAWLPEATGFVDGNAVALAGRPVWLFSVGMPAALPRVMRRWAMREGPKALKDITARIHPQGQRLFSGVIRPEHLPAVSRIILRLMGARFGDYRDWPEIDSWANQIASRLRAASEAPPAEGPDVQRESWDEE